MAEIDLYDFDAVAALLNEVSKHKSDSVIAENSTFSAVENELDITAATNTSSDECVSDDAGSASGAKQSLKLCETPCQVVPAAEAHTAATRFIVLPPFVESEVVLPAARGRTNGHAADDLPSSSPASSAVAKSQCGRFTQHTFNHGVPTSGANQPREYYYYDNVTGRCGWHRPGEVDFIPVATSNEDSVTPSTASSPAHFRLGPVASSSGVDVMQSPDAARQYLDRTLGADWPRKQIDTKTIFSAGGAINYNINKRSPAPANRHNSAGHLLNFVGATVQPAVPAPSTVDELSLCRQRADIMSAGVIAGPHAALESTPMYANFLATYVANLADPIAASEGSTHTDEAQAGEPGAAESTNPLTITGQPASATADDVDDFVGSPHSPSSPLDEKIEGTSANHERISSRSIEEAFDSLLVELSSSSTPIDARPTNLSTPLPLGSSSIVMQAVGSQPYVQSIGPSTDTAWWPQSLLQPKPLSPRHPPLTYVSPARLSPRFNTPRDRVPDWVLEKLRKAQFTT